MRVSPLREQVETARNTKRLLRRLSEIAMTLRTVEQACEIFFAKLHKRDKRICLALVGKSGERQ